MHVRACVRACVSVCGKRALNACERASMHTLMKHKGTLPCVLTKSVILTLFLADGASFKRNLSKRKSSEWQPLKYITYGHTQSTDSTVSSFVDSSAQHRGMKPNLIAMKNKIWTYGHMYLTSYMSEEIYSVRSTLL